MKRIKLFAAVCLLLLSACSPVGPELPAVTSTSEREASRDSEPGAQSSEAETIQYPEPPEGDIARFFTVREILNLLDPYMEQKGYGKVSEWEFSYEHGSTFYYNENVSIELTEDQLAGRLESVYIEALPESGKFQDAPAERDLAVFDALEAYLTGLFKLSEVEKSDYYEDRSGDLFWSELRTVYGKRLIIYPYRDTAVPVKMEPFSMTNEELSDALDSISTSVGRGRVSEWPPATNYSYEILKFTERFAVATYIDRIMWADRMSNQLDLILYRKGAGESDAAYFLELAKGAVRLFEPNADAVLTKLGLDAPPTRVSMAKGENASFHYVQEGNLARLLVNPVSYRRAAFPFTREELINALNEAITGYGLDAIQNWAVTETVADGETARQYRIDEGCCLTLYEDSSGYIAEATLHYSDDLAGLSGRLAYEPLLKALLKAAEPDRREDIWREISLDNFKSTSLKVSNGLRSHSQYMVYHDERNFRIWALEEAG